MADFFLSVPGLLSTAGVGALILLRSGRSRPAAVVRGESSVRLVMQIAISTVILGAGLWVILSGGRYTPDAGRWAAGAIGTVMGYWLKP